MRKYGAPILLLILLIGFSTWLNAAEEQKTQQKVQLGDQRELFIDDYLIASMDNVSLVVHEPDRKEISMVMDKPWEGCGCGYHTVLYDAKLKIYRIYYKSWHHPSVPEAGNHKDRRVRIAMIESKDGIHWTRPNLGLVDYGGNKDNNLLFASGHDFSPFIDLNPKTKPEERYKAMGSPGNAGLYAWSSPDGIHWTKMKKSFVYTKGAFDSQNLAFWSVTENCYVAYFRTVVGGTRYVDRIVSDDFINWKFEGRLKFPKGEGPIYRAQYYVNQIFAYYRAPQIYIGFPARYVDNQMTESAKLLPEWDKRIARSTGKGREMRFGTAVTDTVFITSRDGISFRQSNNVFLRPGLRTKDNWSYGDNYLSWNVVETDSLDADSPRELSMYGTESYFTGVETIFRRFTIRIDGFSSISANNKEGCVVTKPLVFKGKELSLNYRTSAAGLLFVEVCDVNGKTLPGFAKADCDSIDRRVSWKGKSDLSALAGKAVVLKFHMLEADIYSLKFE
ncbi:MAG: hypothetical protein Q4G59_11185 [Planctomycetia bacterium]|nr:hypothetical protein [Planctomycetia bacterium]